MHPTRPPPAVVAAEDWSSPDPAFTSSSGAAHPHGPYGFAPSSDALHGRAVSEAPGRDESVGRGGAAPAGTSAAASAMILRAKVSDLQAELARLRKELRESGDRVASLTDKLNDQKLQNTAVVKRSGDQMAKISDLETAEKLLQDALMREQTAHRETREVLQRAKEAAREKDDLLKDLQMLQFQQQSRREGSPPPIGATASATTVHGTATTVIASDVATLDLQLKAAELDERHARFMEGLRQEVTDCFQRLLASKEEDDAALFVARSATQSCATELDGRLNSLESQLLFVTREFETFSREVEEDTERIMLELMEENKILWPRLQATQFELDKARAELANRTRHTAQVPKEQLDALQHQVTAGEAALRRCQEFITSQTAKLREHEDTMGRVIEEKRGLERRLATLQEAHDALALSHRDCDTQFTELATQKESFGQRVDELETLNMHLTSQTVALADQLRVAEESYLQEARNNLRIAASERDDALAVATRYKSDLEEALERVALLVRELEACKEYLRAYKEQSDEQLAAQMRRDQQELTAHRDEFERALGEARAGTQQRIDEIYDARRQLEEERLARHESVALLRAAEDAAAHAKSDAESATASLRRAEDRVATLQQELDVLKAAHSTNAHRERDLQLQLEKAGKDRGSTQRTLDEERRKLTTVVTTLQVDVRESEKRRLALEEELKRAKGRIIDDDNLRHQKEKLERDRDQLMVEIRRLQQEFYQATQEKTSLQAQLGQARQQEGVVVRLQQNLEELRGRLRQLPQLQGELQDSRQEVHALQEEVRALQQDKRELQERLSMQLDEVRRVSRKDADVERLIREASQQVRRLDRQIEEVNTTVVRQGTPPRSQLSRAY